MNYIQIMGVINFVRGSNFSCRTAVWGRPLFSSALMVVSLFVIGCVATSTNNSSVTHPDSSQNALLRESDHFSYLPATSLLKNKKKDFIAPLNGRTVALSSTDELIELLKKNGLWSLGPRAEISPLLVDSFPGDLRELDVASKKKVFFNTLLPVVMAVLNEVQIERQHLLKILSELGGNPQSMMLSEDHVLWQEKLSADDLAFIKNITRKYRHENAAELLNRINVVPVSLVMAQGALESSWGTSRFASMGNNLFGMWTWGERGIVPLNRAPGMSHKVAVYDSILESVRAYLLTINRIPAYKRLRDLRSETMDSIVLTEGLIYYSERRGDYVEDLQSVINFNKLAIFDRYHSFSSTNVSI